MVRKKKYGTIPSEKNDGIDVRHLANGSSSWHVRKVEVVSLVCDF